VPAILQLDDFLTHRVSTVEEMLRLLRGADDQKVLCRLLLGQHRGGQVIASTDEVDRIEKSFNDWRLRTYVDDMWFQYHEVWRYTSPQRTELFLLQAYLSIFRAKDDGRQLEDFVCLHCDPFDRPHEEDARDEEEKEHTSRHKQGPHLHVVKTHDLTIPHSHFPLNLGHLEHVLASCHNLTVEFRRAVQVLCYEVLTLSRRKH
jgi:hypothetical protein